MHTDDKNGGQQQPIGKPFEFSDAQKSKKQRDKKIPGRQGKVFAADDTCGKCRREV